MMTLTGVSGSCFLRGLLLLMRVLSVMREIGRLISNDHLDRK